MQLVCSWGASVGQLYPNNLKMVALLNLLNFILLFLYIASCGMFTTQIWLQRIFNEHNPAKSKVICLRNLVITEIKTHDDIQSPNKDSLFKLQFHWRLKFFLYTPCLNNSSGHRAMFGKNQLMSDKSCFTTDTVIQFEVKKLFISYQRRKSQKHLVRIGLSCFGFSFCDYFNI